VESLNPVLRDFWATKARNRILYGGRASSKSWDAAGFAIFLAQSCKVKFMCTRQFQNRIDDSVYSLLKIQIERFGLKSKFKVLENKIICLTTGSEFIFYGLWRSIDEVKSTENIDIHWSEEAHLLTEAQWAVLDPTIRKQGSQHWIIFNPRLATDFVYKRFVVNPPPDTIVRKINYEENPFLSDTMIKIIEAAKLDDYDKYMHIYKGVPDNDDDESVIKRSWLEASIDAHIKLGIQPSGIKRIGFDIADSGQDKCANVYAHGSIILWADMWQAAEDELLKSCTRTYLSARDRQSSVTYDSIGVGAAAGAKFAELNTAMSPSRVTYSKFNAGGAVFKPDAIYSTGTKNKDMFSNIKAQAWWLVADRFRNTYNAVTKGQQFDNDELICLSSDMPHLTMLIDELSTPKRDYDNNGRVKVESKKDLAKREVASPNLADALICAFAPEQRPMTINQATLRRT
jgi:phage terminase large subunit